MNVVVAKTETGRALSDAFAVARGRLPGTGLVADRRRQAFDTYERLGLPHLYLGYWVEGSKKMAYKARFRPQERLGMNGWERIE